MIKTISLKRRANTLEKRKWSVSQYIPLRLIKRGLRRVLLWQRGLHQQLNGLKDNWRTHIHYSFHRMIKIIFLTQRKYVKQAHAEGMVSRAAYKLRDMNKEEKIIRNGDVVVDLGAAPGGWTQVTTFFPHFISDWPDCKVATEEVFKHPPYNAGLVVSVDINGRPNNCLFGINPLSRNAAHWKVYLLEAWFYQRRCP